MDQSWFLVSGITMGILVFSFKVGLGCGLAALSKRERLSVASSYLLISLFMGQGVGLIPRSFLDRILGLGVAMHLLIAILLITLGTFTAREWAVHSHDLSRKTFWVLSLPCPACLAATFISCSLLVEHLGMAPWKVGLAVGLLFSVSILTSSTAFVRIRRGPTTLGQVMIFLGLFYVLSILVIPAYLSSRDITLLPPAIPASDLIGSYLFVAIMVILGFVGRRSGVQL